MPRSHLASRTPYRRTCGRAHPAAAVVALAVAGCQTATASSPAPGQAGAASTVAAVNGPDCLTQPTVSACYTPQVFRTGYGISPLLDPRDQAVACLVEVFVTRRPSKRGAWATAVSARLAGALRSVRRRRC